MAHVLKQFTKFSVVLTGIGLLVPAIVAAHVIVTPASVGVGAEQTFNLSMPNEKAIAVTQLKLEIPTGLGAVTPTQKPGWEIRVDRTGEGDAAVVSSITWTGNLAAGLRDDFTFSAQAPAQVTNLNWKAYQTYADGTVVHWDQKPANSDDATGDAGPYSVTKVVNDLQPTQAVTTHGATTSDTLPLTLSIVAMLIALGSLLKKKA